jgi:hypothetical protein
VEDLGIEIYIILKWFLLDAMIVSGAAARLGCQIDADLAPLRSWVKGSIVETRALLLA